MQSPKISGTTSATTTTTMVAHNALQHMNDKSSQPASSSTDNEICYSNGTTSSTATAAVKNGPLHLHDQKQKQLDEGLVTSTSSMLDIGETSTDEQPDTIKEPLHVHITNVSCAEKDTTDESSGCGGMTMTSTASTSSTIWHDSHSRNGSPLIISTLDASCTDQDAIINGDGNCSHVHEKHDPLKSMHTPELAAVVPPSGTDCIALISNPERQSAALDKTIPVVSQDSSSSADNKDPHHHKPIIKSIPGTGSISDNNAAASSAKVADADSDSSHDDMSPNVPLSFTVDVASALDQVLDELENDQSEKSKESAADKEYPCVLQQTSVVDMVSSGTTSPCPDERSIGSGNEDEDGDDESSESSSVRVKSSMLLGEDSLNMIAEMTAPSKKGKTRTSSIALRIQKETAKDNENGVEEQTAKIKCVSENLGHGEATRAPMITGTAAAQFEAISRKNGVHNNGNGNGNGNVAEAVSEAKIKTSSESILVSKPLAPPPQLAPSAPLDTKNKSIGPATIANQSNQKVMVAGSASEQDMKRTEKGMDMLADIILHAAPIPSPTFAANSESIKKSQEPQRHVENNTHAVDHQKEKKGIGQNMVPIGQSLSVYSAIAAQAGVATHQLVPLPAPQPLEREQVHIQPDPQPKQIVSEPAPAPAEAQTYVREIGKIRRFSAATGEFSDWEDLPCQTYGDAEPRRWCELNIDESIEIPLRRGGRLRVFPNFVADGRRLKVSQSMDKCTLYRQYWKEGDESSLESRVQVLLSSKTNKMHNGHSKRGRPGYQYDGVSMMAQPLSVAPQVERLGRDLAELYRLPGNEWNIGANLVCYRTGNDHMAWNSNCDQNQVLILCIIADSQNCTRPILIRPKGHDPLQEGDEEIIVFVGQGDAYEMDGQMQLSYEHCIPKKEDDTSAKRSVVVFRHGKPVSVETDTGAPICSEQTHVNSGGRAPSVKFGHPVREISEGKEVFTKMKLIETGAHRNERKHINGTLRDGCDSILVENQDPMLREDDGLCWLQVTCSKSLGGGSLCQSYHNKVPVRVFRSSELESRYSPALYEDEAGSVLHRYDGLYAVRAMWDTEGTETSSPPPTNGLQHTFFLTRYPKKPVDGTFEAGMHYNKISIHELWNEIQKRNGVRKPKLFQVPQPFMEHAPIGDESNLSRRRKENIKLPSEENLKNRRARRKRKNASSPDMDGDTRHSVPIRPPTNFALSNSCSYSDYDSEKDCNNQEINSEEELDAGSTRRPKRASAAAARSFLQKAMLNKYRVGQKERPSRKRRPSIKLLYSSLEESQSKRLKVIDNDITAHSDMSDDESNSISGHGLEKEKAPAPTPDEVVSNIGEIDSNIDESTSKLPSKTRRKPAVAAQKPKRVYKRKQAKKSDSETVLASNDIVVENKSLAVKKKVIDHSSIQVGYRVNVEYRDVLYKATIKRVREKEGSYDYLIHYDGNKKTNLRWIQSSMINNVISEVAEVEEAKPAAKKGRKPAKKKKQVVQKDEDQGKKEVDNGNELEQQKFDIGSEFYVEYRKVLYNAVVRKLRLNRKGNCEYLVHYDGFKKAADRWVKTEDLFQINDESTILFNKQRGESNAAEKIDDSKKHPHIKRSPRNVPSTVAESGGDSRRTRGRATEKKNDHSPDDGTLDMSDHDAGVEFLPGSCVFIVRKDALYLAKMMKRKKFGNEMEYLVHFDKSTSDHDTWVPLSAVYEINPKARRIFDRTANKREDMNDEEEDEEEPSDDQKQTLPEVISPTRTSSRRTSKRPAKYGQEDDEEVQKSVKKTSRTKNTTKPKANPPKPADMSILSYIDSGCVFLPGSTIFVLWKSSLYLAKMLKRRGKGDNMEYLVHSDGFDQEQDAWVSVAFVYEINPKTKRVFSKQKK